jgi:hypothetical protein
MGDVFFRMIEAANGDRSDAAPTRVFDDEATAIEWLASVDR